MRPIRPLVRSPVPDKRQVSRRRDRAASMHLHKEQQLRLGRLGAVVFGLLLVRFGRLGGPGFGHHGAQRVLQPG